MEDSASCFNYIEIEPHIFNKILHQVGPRIQNSDTNFIQANILILVFRSDYACTTLLVLQL